MSCCGEREKLGEVKNEQKWDYINLSDFRSTSCFNPLSYGILYIFLIISVAVYAVDLFTCANLLFFDRWSGQVKPAIPFHISRWIFTACILLSWILLAYRWWRAIRAIRTGVVAASYLDPLGVRLQSIRVGPNGRGWRRFLVFAALTKGRKGAEYVALFTYFSFEAWLRICFAEGPRQVINALTLYSVMRADLVPDGQHAAKDGHTPVAQFFMNVQILANKDKEQAAILFGMLFTLIIWIFTALSLMLAVLMYIFFLWHHIRDPSLSLYCRRKIDTRLHKIVMVKVNRALEKDNRPRAKQDAKGMGAGDFPGGNKRQPTLPVLGGSQDIPPISRQTTQTEISSFGSRPPSRNTGNTANVSRREPTVPDVFANPPRPEPPIRSTTQSSLNSNTSYASDAPLMGSAGDMGFGPPGSRPAPSRMDSERTFHSGRLPPGRSFTGDSYGTQRSYNSSESRTGPPSRQNSDMGERMTPGNYNSQIQGRKPMPRELSSNSVGGRPPGLAPPSRRPTQEYEMHSQPPIARSNGPSREGGYVAFKPHYRNNFPGTAHSEYSTSSSGHPPARNFTLPYRPTQSDCFGPNGLPPQRSGTAPPPQTAAHESVGYNAYGGSMQALELSTEPFRPGTASPGGWNGQQRPVPPRS